MLLLRWLFGTQSSQAVLDGRREGEYLQCLGQYGFIGMRCCSDGEWFLLTAMMWRDSWHPSFIIPHREIKGWIIFRPIRIDNPIIGSTTALLGDRPFCILKKKAFMNLFLFHMNFFFFLLFPYTYCIEQVSMYE